HYLADLVARHQVTGWVSIPSLYRTVLEHCNLELLQALELVILAGEPLWEKLVEQHYAALPFTSALYNEYGPTEASVWSCVAKMSNVETAVSIGRPIWNTR